MQARADASRLERTGRTALMLFAALSLAGVLTLFSQAGTRGRAGRGDASTGWTALDPGRGDAGALEKLLPAAIEEGASPPTELPAEHGASPARNRAPGKVLRLR